MGTKGKPLTASESLFENTTGGPPMTTALVEHEAQPETTNAALMLCLEKGIDPGKVIEWQEQMARNAAAESFGRAMTKFQALCPVVHKSKQAKGGGNFAGYAYASYDDVMRAAGPVLKDCGLAISFSTEQVEKQLKVTCRIRHGIHYEDHSLTVPVPDMRVNDTQKYGGALSYAKRYALCAALNIVTSDEDDDAASVYESITDSQAANIQELLDDLGPAADRVKFLAWLGADSISSIQASDYAKAIDALQRKRKA